jgi:DNA-binding transcriptional ArsR family regulator
LPRPATDLGDLVPDKPKPEKPLQCGSSCRRYWLKEPVDIEKVILRLMISNYLCKLLLMPGTFNLNASFAALADPTRRAILARLALGEASVTELANPFEMTQPAISQHLKVLEEAGLIVQRIDGTKRPRRLAKAGIEAIDQWLAMLRKALEKNYERLDEVLAALEPTTKGKKR